MDRVILNVGGKRFETTRSTINKYPEATLAKIIGPNGSPDSDGIYFIDRNPEIFSIILEYYRNDYLACPPGIDPNLFDREIDFWGLQIQRERTLRTPAELFDLSAFVINFLGNLRTSFVESKIITDIYRLIRFSHRKGFDHCVVLLGDKEIIRRNRERLEILENYFNFTRIETLIVPFDPKGIAKIRDISWTFDTSPLENPTRGQVAVCYF